MSFLSKLTSSMFTKKQSYSYADQEKDMALIERAGKRVAQQQRAFEERLIVEKKLGHVFNGEFPNLSDNEMERILDMVSSQSTASHTLTEDQKIMLIVARAEKSVARQQRASQAQFIAEIQAGASSDFNKKNGLSDKEKNNMSQLFKDAYIKSKE